MEDKETKLSIIKEAIVIIAMFVMVLGLVTLNIAIYLGFCTFNDVIVIIIEAVLKLGMVLNLVLIFYLLNKKESEYNRLHSEYTEKKFEMQKELLLEAIQSINALYDRLKILESEVETLKNSDGHKRCSDSTDEAMAADDMNENDQTVEENKDL